MTKKEKQVPSYMNGDFLLYLMELMEEKKVHSKKDEEPYRTDVLYEQARFAIHSEEVNDDGVVEIIEPSLSSLSSIRKKIRINDDL